jgi:hypothetical protein
MITIHEIARLNAGPSDRRSVVEASEINLGPGEWPDVLRVKAGRDYYKVRMVHVHDELASVEYQSLDPNDWPHRITVLND